MDNASYHVTQINKPPTMNGLKADIQKWLTENAVHYKQHLTKAELMCLVYENKTTPMYKAEELLKEHGHEVLKLPPYHCDLNAIELIRSLNKRKIASQNLEIPGGETENLKKECFNSVTANDWKKCTDHTINAENSYKARDRITETELEPFIISVHNDDTDSDFSYEDMEFLDSKWDSD